ncbi:hypothetical protein ACA910_013524 [Epithemia clementina (nom. ined.)]
MCCFCFSTAPLAGYEKRGRYGYTLGAFDGYDEKYALSLCQIPCSKEIGCCCVTILCFGPAQMYLREKALNHVEPGSGCSNYQCCQGYFGGFCCFEPGHCCESTCPCPCMCLEVLCCPGFAVSSTSMIIRERYRLGLDRDDVRLIRCNNCLQITAMVPLCLDNDLVDCTVRCLADTVFCCVSGCMTAQCNHEINLRDAGLGITAPHEQIMEGRYQRHPYHNENNNNKEEIRMLPKIQVTIPL